MSTNIAAGEPQGDAWNKYLAAYERLLAATSENEKQTAQQDVDRYRLQIALPRIIETGKAETRTL